MVFHDGLRYWQEQEMTTTLPIKAVTEAREQLNTPRTGTNPPPDACIRPERVPSPDRDHRYSSLIGVLMEAVEQASTGKGHERHDNGRRFEEQPILEICRMLGTPDFARGQVMKKTAESARLEPSAAVKELLGAINYAAAAIILIREQGK